MSTVSSTSARGGNQPAQKLKDSCDMCSSSKVKCNKEKPVCSRCRKLGYPCFYSPARRIGRPHPSRRNASISRKSPDAQRRTSSFQDGMSSMPATPKDLPLPLSDPQLQPAPTILPINASAIGYSQNPLQWLDELYLSGGAVDDPDASAAAAAMAAATPMALRSLQTDKELPGLAQTPLADPSQIFGFDLNHPDSYWVPPMGPEPDTGILPLEIVPTHSSQASSTDNGEFSTCGHAPSDTSETDCVTGAIDILRRLQTNSPIRRSSNEPFTGMDSAGSELLARLQVASSAIHRLSTILVCPCSQKTYVAILVASVCLVIMDVYDTLFQRSRDSRLVGMPPPFVPNADLDTMLPMSMDLDSVGLGLDPVGTSLSTVDTLHIGELDSHVSSMQVLEELSKLANVVMQFARRYKCDVGSQSAATLSALADSLKLRLRLVTNEAFERSSIH